jgi:hypothetical protein
MLIGCALFLALSAVIGCGSGSALSPAFQPQVANNPDNFQFQSTGVQNVSQTLQYTWSNSGTHASINQATTVTAGSAVLSLRDSQGATVYTGDLVNNGTFTSIAGQTGNWTIVLTLSNYSGTLNFRVQMAP